MNSNSSESDDNNKIELDEISDNSQISMQLGYGLIQLVDDDNKSSGNPAPMNKEEVTSLVDPSNLDWWRARSNIFDKKETTTKSPNVIKSTTFGKTFNPTSKKVQDRLGVKKSD